MSFLTIPPSIRSSQPFKAARNQRTISLKTPTNIARLFYLTVSHAKGKHNCQIQHKKQSAIGLAARAQDEKRISWRRSNASLCVLAKKE
jgi:hypothetical protein